MKQNPRAHFGAHTSAAEALDGIDLTGKRALVTGGTSGIGVETARALATQGAHVIITTRDVQKAKHIVHSIQESAQNSSVEYLELELASLYSVRDAAKRFLAEYNTLDILINNAGVMACPRGTTEDGFETQFGTNHIGHFLFTCLLAPALINAPSARVVALSSAAHRMSPVVFEDIHFKGRPYEKWSAYGQSKTANILFAVALDAKLAQHNVRAFAVHPGVIQTDLQRHMPPEELEQLAQNFEARGIVLKSIPQGAATSVYAATAPELNQRGGLYLADCTVSPVDDHQEDQTLLRSYAVDAANADTLWTISEHAVGSTFDFS